MKSKTVKKEQQEEKVYAVGVKGFGPGMICRGKQYAENTVFEEPEAELCESGIHYCENPLDVLNFYPLIGEDGKPNEFAAVEALAKPKTDNIKSVTTKIRIGTKLSLKSFIKAAVDFSFEWMKKNNSASGDNSQLAASGYNSQLAASGDSSQLAASGDCSNVEATGKESVIAAVGINVRVKAALGCFMACAEWKQDNEGTWHPVNLLSGKVDGKKIKADTWYTVKGGKYVEVGK